jgi:hypothetical protein
MLCQRIKVVANRGGRGGRREGRGAGRGPSASSPCSYCGDSTHWKLSYPLIIEAAGKMAKARTVYSAKQDGSAKIYAYSISISAVCVFTVTAPEVKHRHFCGKARDFLPALFEPHCDLITVSAMGLTENNSLTPQPRQDYLRLQ